MTFYEKYNKLLEIEKTYNLYELEIDGLYVWPYLRNKIYGIIHREGFSGSDATKILTPQLNIYNSELTLSQQVQQREGIVFNFSRLGLGDEGQVVDFSTELVVEKLKEEQISFYQVNFDVQGLYNDYNKYYNCDDAKIEYLTCKDKYKFRDQKHVLEISTMISNGLEINFDINDWATEIYRKNNIYHTYFIDIYSKLKPKFIIVTSSYMRSEVIIPAKLLGIPVIEVQYAAIIDYHSGYHLSGNCNKFGPDALLTWGNYWSEFKKFGSNIKEISEIGKYGYKGVNISSEKTEVLVISQNLVSDIMIEVTKKLAENNQDSQIKFRKHPNENLPLEFVKFVENSNNIEFDNRQLSESLSFAKYVVGTNSTVLVEGLEYGCKILLAHTYMTDFLIRLIEDKQAYYLESYDLSVYETMEFSPLLSHVLLEKTDLNLLEFINKIKNDNILNTSSLDFKCNNFIKKLNNNKISDFSDWKLAEELISIVIPCYNCETTIVNTLKSVYNMKSNFELIIIDDGSTDNTKEVINSFIKNYDNCTFIKLEKGSGSASYPRTIGIEYATSKYIYFLDADDILRYDIFDLGFSYMIKNDLDILKFSVAVKDYSGIGRYSVGSTCINGKLDVMLKNSPFLWNHMYKTHIIKENHIEMRFGIAEDLNFNAKYLTYVENYGVLDQDLVIYNKMESTQSKNMKFEQIYNLILNHIDTYQTILKIDNKMLKLDFKFRIVQTYLLKGINMYVYIDSLKEDEKNKLEKVLLELINLVYEIEYLSAMDALDAILNIAVIYITPKLITDDSMVVNIRNDLANLNDYFKIDDQTTGQFEIPINTEYVLPKYKIETKNIFDSRRVLTTKNGQYYVLVYLKNGVLKTKTVKSNGKKYQYIFYKFKVAQKVTIKDGLKKSSKIFEF